MMCVRGGSGLHVEDLIVVRTWLDWGVAIGAPCDN